VSGKSNKESLEEDVVIARIVKARGIRGEVACTLETDFPSRFASLKHVTVWMPDGARRSLKIENHWFHNQRVILKFEGYDTMTAAQALAGGRLMIAEGDPHLLEEGQLFERQVIGSEVVNCKGEKLGHVARVMRTGGTDLLVMAGADGREHLVPFAAEICTSVDVAAKRITIDPPTGLFDL
jgi:16S rRNA processing protein RimM